MIVKLIFKLYFDLLQINKGIFTRSKPHIFRSFSALVMFIIIGLVMIGVRQKGKLQSLELLAYDRLVRLKKQERKDNRLLLVEITDTDIKNQERWPLSDDTLARLLNQLQQHQPSVIGLDIYRDIAHPPGTSRLKKELQKSNVVSIKYLGSGANTVAAPPGVAPRQIGFNDVVLDSDSKLRRSLVYARLDTEELYSFALRLSLAYLQNNPEIDGDFQFDVDDEFLYFGDARLKKIRANSGGYLMESSEALGWQLLIDYQSPDIAHRVSLTEVLEGKVSSNLIKNKVVIIGTTASSINDFFFTPYGGKTSDMPGAIAHAQMVSQIIALALEEKTQLWFFPEVVEWFWIFAWSLAGVAIAIKLNNPFKIIALAVLETIALWGVCWLAFLMGGWIPFVPTALSLSLVLCAIFFQRVIGTYFYDFLTGLPNQTLFIKQLQKLRQSSSASKSIMVLCLDLDRFKLINDALGYQAGDYLLSTTAKRLQAGVSDAIIARVGGDEFAIAKVVADETTGLSLFQQLQTQLNLPFDLQGLQTSTSVTTGITFNSPMADCDPEDMLRCAKTAMYQAKASGKVSHRVFATTMRTEALKRLQLEADIYKAIEKQEFELYYQPIIDLTTGKIAGFESLIRWHSPQRGFVSPGVFIPVAEETGAIIPLGEWILREACNQMFRWQQQFTEAADFFISVNLSGRQFAQSDLVTKIEAILDVTKLQNTSLKLEITESMVMENIEAAIVMLDKLKALNIRLSMDDFGTGFSSFSYLHRFPMDTLKVDRSFVSNMHHSQKNFEIVSTIVLLAHKLDMDLVAEGIETEQEKTALQNLNCEYGQGYLFAKPLPVKDVNNLLANWRK